MSSIVDDNHERRGGDGYGALYFSRLDVLGSYAYQCNRCRVVSPADGAVHVEEVARGSTIYKQILRNEKAIEVR